MGIQSNLSNLVQQVKDNTYNILKGLVNCPYTACPKCHQEVDKFKRHEARTRIFLILVENMVVRVQSLITRWKCPLCGKTFTFYPDFALPYKRYVLPNIMDICGQYLEDNDQSYRKVVTSNNTEYYYEKPSENGTYSVLAHSTPHRWLTGLSGFFQTMQNALEHIKQKKPHTDIFREISKLRIPDKKFRSPSRERQLIRCRKLLLIQEEFFQIFSMKFFPNFATMHNWS